MRTHLPYLTLLAASIPLCAAESRDAKSIEIAEAMMQAMGGTEAWMKARFVRFDFHVSDKDKTLVKRSHLWDKQTGRYRLDSTTKDGKPAVTLFHIGDQKGQAYADGKQLSGDAAATALKSAYQNFINDMYWLAMPWKWLDAGVNLKYVGRKPHEARQYDVVELTFGKVGLTPGDKYLAFVSPESKLMEYWEYTLQNGSKGAWKWSYTTTAGIKLAANHTNAEGRSIHMGDVRVTPSVDEALFSDPARPLR